MTLTACTTPVLRQDGNLRMEMPMHSTKAVLELAFFCLGMGIIYGLTLGLLWKDKPWFK